MNIASKSFLLAPIAILLASCAGSADRYPSLATRDAERVSGSFTPSPPPPPVPPVATTQDLTELVAMARRAHGQFLEARPTALELVQAASGLGEDSNERAAALVAIADLRSHRSETAGVLGDLDTLEVEASTSFAPTKDIRAAQSEVEQILSAQDAALLELWGEIAR